MSYQPFGETSSTGSAAPGSTLYTSTQWNDGQALAAFGLVNLGARVYDPVLGRFLSRDPLVVPRTAATTNPYAFAHNDPQNSSDPTGLDPGWCMGPECQGPGGGGFPGGGGGPSEINDPRLYLPSQGGGGGGGPAPNPRAASRPPPTPGAATLQAPAGMKTVLGRTMMLEALVLSGLAITDGSFDYDAYAATGASVMSLIDALANSQQGAQAIADSYNATYDKIASASAGFGDGLAWFIPTRTLRNATGHSVNEESGYYTGGTVVGVVGSFFLPSPTSIAGTSRAARAGRAQVQAEVKAVAAELRAGACKTNCGYSAIAFESTMSGTPMAQQGVGAMATTVIEAHFGTTFVA
nr:RHS repeat-associated core domain-containing protein [Corallococcus sp. NCSPR001]